MEQIRRELEGSDDKTSLDELQSKEVLLGLSNGVDVSLYADPKYDFKQMEQIRLALEEGIDTQTLLNPDISSKEMRNMRLKLESLK